MRTCSWLPGVRNTRGSTPCGRSSSCPRAPTPRIDFYLDPANVQMASARTYGLLPNVREIDAALGNDETGRLTYG